MAESINFNDAEVTVEIVDAILGKIIVTDFLQTDSSKLDFLKNRDKIALKTEVALKQDKLTAGANISITDDNVISAQLNIVDVSELVSEDEGNDIRLGDDGKLFVQKPAIISVNSGDFTFDDTMVSGCDVSAAGNSQIRISFIPVQDITREMTPYSVITISDVRVLPILADRYGQVWDPRTFESVGFCQLKNDGELTIKVISTLSVGEEYIILV